MGKKCVRTGPGAGCTERSPDPRLRLGTSSLWMYTTPSVLPFGNSLSFTGTSVYRKPDSGAAHSSVKGTLQLDLGVCVFMVEMLTDFSAHWGTETRGTGQGDP